MSFVGGHCHIGVRGGGGKRSGIRPTLLLTPHAPLCVITTTLYYGKAELDGSGLEPITSGGGGKLSIMAGDMGRPETLAEALMGVNHLFVVVPGTEDR